MQFRKNPPFGMQTTGGPRNRPAVIYPDNAWTWPDLSTEIQAVLKIDQGVCTQKEVQGERKANRFQGLTIRSDEGPQNGMYIKGGEKCVISASTVEMSGNGVNDFMGIGTGAMVDESGELVLRNCEITTNGVVRPCTVATRGGVLRVYGCKLTANGGTLPDGYTFRPGPGMLVPPPALGIGGNCRAHLSMDHSSTYFYDSEITAEGWGALSTDAGNGYVYLEANRSTLRVRTPGYGAYADGDCHVTLNDCLVETATHCVIMAGLSEVTMRNVAARSGKYFAMIHNVMGVPTEVAEMTVTGGDVETGQECILIKSANTYLDLTGVTMKSDCHVLLRTVINSDECATKVGEHPVFGNNVVFSDMELKGDILNEDEERTLTVTLNGTSLEGTVQGAYLAMNQSSAWIATGDSTVVLMGDVQRTQIDAASGITITAGAGEGCTLKSGILPSGGTLKIAQPRAV